jgi:hypothetical protein
MVLITASLSAFAVAGADGARVVGTVGTGHGSAGEEKGGEETSKLHDCFGGWSRESREEWGVVLGL